MYEEEKEKRREYSPGELSKLLGVTNQTLLRWANDGKIKTYRTEGGHRRYIYTNIKKERFQEEGKKKIIYARVSTRKQSADLERQIAILKHKYPSYELISDIGSGINFKRRGLIALLDRVFAGDISEVVVAHRDRLSRFGFELFEYIFNRMGVKLEVISDNDIKEPAKVFVDDVLSIITVFTAKYYGSRKYDIHKKNKDIPKQGTANILQKMPRSIKVHVQPNGKKPKIKRISKRTIKA